VPVVMSHIDIRFTMGNIIAGFCPDKDIFYR
jgi:hypothetical protein